MLDQLVPVADKPMLDISLDSVGITAVRDAILTDDGLFQRFAREGMSFRDDSSTPWVTCTAEPHTYLRAAEYTMPLPNDVPKAVARAVAIPEFCKASMALRVRNEGHGLRVEQVTSTPDVPFGDRFYTQDVFSFQPFPGGGVSVKRWTCTVWLKPFSLPLRMIEYTIKDKTLKNAELFCSPFIDMLKRMVASVVAEGNAAVKEAARADAAPAASTQVDAIALAAARTNDAAAACFGIHASTSVNMGGCGRGAAAASGLVVFLVGVMVGTAFAQTCSA